MAGETFHFTRNASVVLLDRDLFSRHYEAPLTHILGNRRDDPDALSPWLAKNFSIVSGSQLGPNDVNLPIPATGATVDAVRPERYGRACILDMRNLEGGGGFGGAAASHIDLKGVGVAPDMVPYDAPHGSGLLSIVQAIEEYLWYRIVEEILLFCGAPFRCAAIYGIIKLGFDMKSPNGGSIPAAIIFREPTVRGKSSDLPKLRSSDQKDILALELMFRRFGVTTSPDSRVKVIRHTSSWTYLSGCPGGVDPTPIARSAYPEERLPLENVEFELVNVQIGKSEIDGAATLVDFGQYRSKDEFVHAILSTVADRPGGFGGIMWPDHPSYPQPDRDTKLTAKYWGKSKTNRIAAILFQLASSAKPNTNVNLRDLIERMIKIEANRWRCGMPQRH